MSDKSNKVVAVKDLETNPNKKLTSYDKQVIMKILEKEFVAQTTVYHEKRNEITEQAFEEWKEINNVSELVEKYKELSSKLAQITAELNKLGVNNDGSKGYRTSVQFNTFVEEKVGAILRQPMVGLHKYQAKLLSLEYHWQANVLLREVIGNDVIPTITYKEMKKLTE